MDISPELKKDIEKTERKAEAFIFYLSVYWRILYGLASLLLGIYFLWFTGVTVAELFSFLVQSELVEDPNDFLITFFGHWLGNNQTPVTFFTSVYLIFWGVLDMFLYISIILKKMWAYTVAIYLISFFSAYMFYRFFHTGSMLLLGLICFDLLIVWLTYRERARTRLAHAQS